MPATYDDANLLLRLYELRREDRMRQARDWFVRECHVTTLEEFDKLCPVGSENNAFFRQVTTYWDMACSFVTAGVLHDEIFIQNNLEHLLVYIRIRQILPLLRQRNQTPLTMRNLEITAKRALAWIEEQQPGASAGYEQRFSPRKS